MLRRSTRRCCPLTDVRYTNEKKSHYNFKRSDWIHVSPDDFNEQRHLLRSRSVPTAGQRVVSTPAMPASLLTKNNRRLYSTDLECTVPPTELLPGTMQQIEWTGTAPDICRSYLNQRLQKAAAIMRRGLIRLRLIWLRHTSKATREAGRTLFCQPNHTPPQNITCGFSGS